MSDAAQTALLPALSVTRATPLAAAANGLRYASFGFTEVSSDSLKHIVEAVPYRIAASLEQRAYYFVPLAIGETEETEIARGFTLDLGDRATCHRNVTADGVECTFISARLMQDRFALAFEFFINIGHQFVDEIGVPPRFEELTRAQARAEVRGETSQDAYEARKRAFEPSTTQGTVSIAASASLFGTRDDHPVQPADPSRSSRTEVATGAPVNEREAKLFYEAAFSDTLAIYMLSLAMDLDYADLREREYPLLAAPALADRLRLIAELYPPPPTYEFNIRYRRRH